MKFVLQCIELLWSFAPYKNYVRVSFSMFIFIWNTAGCISIILSHPPAILLISFQSSVHLVLLQDLRPVLYASCSSKKRMTSVAQEDVQQHLKELFQSISHELPDEAVPEATDQTTRLLFKLFDRWNITLLIQHYIVCFCIYACAV